VCRRRDCLQHPVHIARQLVIPKPDDTITRLLDRGCSLLVIRSGVGMLAAIDFHYEALTAANKVANIARDRQLPAELEAIKLSGL
jgi:Cys-tRNA synthase (O-phospho-L-seryl-tRNA:Cys-tRNA synthase)